VIAAQAEPKPLTDEEIVREVAEKVMGWEEFGAEVAYPKVGLVVLRPLHPNARHEAAMVIFNPLEDDADACAILGQAERYTLTETSTPDCTISLAYCSVFLSKVPRGPWGEATVYASDFPEKGVRRRRAICLAALRAVGEHIDAP
jgi:hypothetical protein